MKYKKILYTKKIKYKKSKKITFNSLRTFLENDRVMKHKTSLIRNRTGVCVFELEIIKPYKRERYMRKYKKNDITFLYLLFCFCNNSRVPRAGK